MSKKMLLDLCIGSLVSHLWISIFFKTVRNVKTYFLNNFIGCKRALNIQSKADITTSIDIYLRV